MKRPWTQRWQPPETDEEREQRESFVTAKRARAIRAEIEADPLPVTIAAGARPCGLAVDAVCYLPASRCCDTTGRAR